MNVIQVAVVAAAALLAFAQAKSILNEGVSEIRGRQIETRDDEEYRLPETLSPEIYTVSLAPFIEEGNFTVHGSVDIVINVVQATNLITMHAKNLSISSIAVTLSDSSTVNVASQSLNEVTDILTLTLASTLAANSKFKLSIEYVGILSDDMTGFYRSSYTDSNGNLKWIATTQFQPTYARQAFPCFDEPAFKARFNIIINRAEELHAISNMPLVATSEPINGRITDVFAETPLISTYLLAFIISDFDSLTTSNGNFSVWARPNAIYQGDYALRVGPEILAFYTKTFGHEYPLPKMDMAALSDFSWGAMENWGLITYRETAMLYDEKHSSATAKARVATVVAHELAHMWFGNIITLAWWDYAWLNEGFARRYQYLATDAVEPSWNLRYQFLVEQHHVVFGNDALETAHPLSSSVLTPSQISNHFDTISYNKGASILRMIENILGESVWHAVLHEYIEANLYGNVEPDDLWLAIQGQVTISGIDLGGQSAKTVFDTWTLQAGYPVVRVNLDRSTGIAEISQERFLLRGTEDSVTNLTWWVPISFVSESSPDFDDTSIKYWLGNETDNVKVSDGSEDWVLFNVQETGYYRVNYDDESWTKIIAVLNSEKFETIHVLNRAQIIDDLLNLARADYINYKTVFDATRYLTREENCIPWKALFTGLEYLNRRLVGHDDIYTLFQKHVLALIDDRYNTLGFDDVSGEDWLAVLNRRELLDWACNYGHKECISKSLEYFAAFRADTSKTVSPNQRTAVYCTAIKYGTSDDWYFLWNQYGLANVAADQIVILQTLGCSRNHTILYDYLHYLIEEERGIRPQDMSTVYSAVYTYGGLVGVEATLDFIRDYYADVESYYGSLSYVSSILSGASLRLSTNELLNKFSTLIDTHADPWSSLLSSLSSQLSLAKYELNWYDDNAPTIINWLSETYPDVDTSATTDYKLPTNIIPETYEIHLTPWLEVDNFTFHGIVDTVANVITATNKIVIHAHQITWDVITVIANSAEIEIVNVTYSETYHFLTIELDSTIYAGSVLGIHLEYSGILNTEMRGFYRSSYFNDQNEQRWLAATHLEPVAARRLFPCFDEPALKARFTIHVNRPQDYNVLSNMPLNYSSSVVDGRVWDTFEQSSVMSTYLVAVIVSDFKSLTNEAAKFGVWARPNAINQAAYALSVGPPLVTYFENILGHKYQLPKLDMTALPDFTSGAMENWGLLTYRETRMLVDEENTSAPDKQVIANVISHEITHQWFGDLVSPEWWNYLWLNEGFARYYQYHATANVETFWGLESQFVVEQLQIAFASDGLTSTHAMSYDVYTPAQVRGIFDTISYAKAASVLRMMVKTFGPTLFHNALHDYLEARQYNFATPEHLWTAFQGQIDSSSIQLSASVKTIMDSWVKQAGFPVLNVSISAGVATLSQEKFLLRNTVNANVKQTWWIPVTWATQSNSQFTDTTPKYWLSTESASITVNNGINEWIIFNLQESGYYRVNYDIQSWQRIITALKSDDLTKIHELNRASIIDDLLNLARIGYVDYATVFEATQYLRNETNYIPWRAAINGLVYLNRRLAGTKAYGLYKQHILAILETAYANLGFEDVDGEDYYDTLLRRYVLLWACTFEHEGCINKSRELFAAWRADSSAAIPVNQRTAVYCTAIKYGTSEDWEFLWTQYQKSNVATEHIVILSALGCSQNTTILKNYLYYGISNFSDYGIRTQDSTTVFSSVYSAGLFGAEYVLDFVEAYHEDMYTYYGDYSSVASILSGVALRLSTPELIDKFELFIKNNNETLSSISSSLNSYLTLAKYELNWYNENSPAITKWLSETYEDETSSSSDWRLPKDILPDTYDIYLSPDLENFTFSGEVYSTMTVASSTSQIVFHAFELTIHEILVYRNTIDLLTISSQKYDPITHKLTLSFDTPFAVGTPLTVYSAYTGILNDEMRGFYRSSYQADDGTTRWLATTQFQPTHARRAFPCFDEPSFKAKFTVNIETPIGYRTISNTPFSQASSGETGIWNTFEQTVPMSSYLVAFIVSDFGAIENEADTFKLWARRAAVEHGDYALSAGKKILSFLANYTDVPYPLAKMDMAAIPDFSAGAMENWGLVTYREYGLLSNENVTSATYKRYITTIVAHELVHMWFGNLVTCDWWDYTWLNEGFAQYYQYFVGDAVEPESNLLQQFVLYGLQTAMETDASASIRAMNNHVSSPSEISSGFDTIAYAKSASVIRMMQHSFGSKTFMTALHNYLEANKYGTTIPDKLWVAIQNQVDQDGTLGNLNQSVKTVMDSWISQSGYPVIHASLTSGVVTLTQERFLLTRTESSNINYNFWIPVTYTTELSPNFDSTEPSLWFGESSASINLGIDDKWFILNVQEVGYYRVNYDSVTWSRIIATLQSSGFEIIHEINRAQIIDDLLNLARSGYIEHSLALKGTLYLEQELNHLPWKAFFNGVAYLSQRFEGQSAKKLLNEYVIDIIDNVYEKIGFSDIDGEGQLNELNRQLIISSACNYGHEGCIEHARNLFVNWRKDASQWISPNIRPAVYCTALKYGTNEDWEFLWEQYKTTNFATEQVVILSALGCTTNATTLHTYLGYGIATDQGIRRQDSSAVFSSVYGAGQFGVDQTLNFLMARYDDMYEYHRSWSNVLSIFSAVAARLSTKEQIQTLENFIDNNPDLVSESLVGLSSYVTSAKSNLEWYETNSPAITAWLENPEAESQTTTTTTTTTTEAPLTTTEDPDSGSGSVTSSANIIAITIISILTFWFSANI